MTEERVGGLSWKRAERERVKNRQQTVGKGERGEQRAEGRENHETRQNKRAQVRRETSVGSVERSDRQLSPGESGVSLGSTDGCQQKVEGSR